MNIQTAIDQQARLAALYDVSSRLGASLDLDEVLTQVMDSIIQLTHAERGFLMLVDELTGELQTMAARNVDQKTLDDASMQVSRTFIRRVVDSGEGVLTDNAQEDDRFAGQQSVIGYQLRSIMCAPLKARGRTFGAVYVDNRLMAGVFSQADLDLLLAFAAQAAIAIENARLFTRTDHALARRVEELTLFQTIDQELNRSLDLHRVLRLALQWAVRLTKADSGSIGLFVAQEDESEQVLRLLIYDGIAESDEPKLVPAGHPVLAEVLAQEQPVLSYDVTLAQSIDGTPSAVQLAVPIKRDGVITGLITLESQQRHAIDAEDLAFVQRLADRAAVAIKNARLYEDVQKANDAKSDFISLVTHELRVPMTSIKGYTDLMASGMTGPLTDQQKQFLEVVQRNLDRMGTLIRDLSDINRIESGRMKFECRPFDLGDVIEDVAESLRQVITRRQQALTLDIAADVPDVYADPARVGQVVTNLLSNAHKYTPDGGAIAVRVSHSHAAAAVSITDNGIGISEENQARLFTQFFRAEDRAVREQPGWGLGLSIVKKMVEAQGGEITVASALGEGSTFAFTIPLANIEAESSQ